MAALLVALLPSAGCATGGGAAPAATGGGGSGKHLFTLQVGFDDGSKRLVTVREGAEHVIERSDAVYGVTAQVSRDTLGLVEVGLRRTVGDETQRATVVMPPAMASPVPEPAEAWGALDWVGVREVRPPLRSDDDVLGVEPVPTPTSP